TSAVVFPSQSFLLQSTEIFLLSSCLLIRQYHFVNQPLNWTEAQTYCRQKYTDLAPIENSKEMDKLINTISSAGYSYHIWIGLYNEMNCRWSDGFIGSFTGNNYNYNYWTSQDTSNARSDQLSRFPFICYGSKGEFSIKLF
uniref:C-type lectin domain-containing protein n=1 Tax=Oryzias latipes TaxID=8090 RepID=H2M376_ORYLA